jgi:hypothetical protein
MSCSWHDAMAGASIDHILPMCVLCTARILVFKVQFTIKSHSEALEAKSRALLSLSLYGPDGYMHSEPGDCKHTSASIAMLEK